MRMSNITEDAQATIKKGNFPPTNPFNFSEDELQSRVNAAIVRYCVITCSQCPEMLITEWMSFMNILSPPDSSYIAESLIRFEDAEICKGIRRKWQIDKIGFITLLKKFDFVQRCAIIEVADRYWHYCHGPEVNDLERLFMCGANIKDNDLR